MKIGSSTCVDNVRLANLYARNVHLKYQWQCLPGYELRPLGLFLLSCMLLTVVSWAGVKRKLVYRGLIPAHQLPIQDTLPRTKKREPSGMKNTVWSWDIMLDHMQSAQDKIICCVHDFLSCSDHCAIEHGITRSNSVFHSWCLFVSFLSRVVDILIRMFQLFCCSLHLVLV